MIIIIIKCDHELGTKLLRPSIGSNTRRTKAVKAKI